jgi:hypothetical protein
MATHGRVLDRRRFELLIDGGDPAAVLAALDGYRNRDGGYGWGLEPDLRSPESQPSAAMHALEVLAEVAPVTTPRSTELCDWLGATSLPDGGLPFACSLTDEAGCAPWWRNPDVSTSSLQVTAQVAANAHHVAKHDAAVRTHPWLRRATEWCLAVIDSIRTKPFAYELLFAVRFLDAVADLEPDALGLLDKLAAYIPADGVVPVAGGVEGEALGALDFATRPGGPVREMFEGGILERELGRLTDAQQPDGGWTVTFASVSPAAALEWRAYATVEALIRLRRHHVLTG